MKIKQRLLGNIIAPVSNSFNGFKYSTVKDYRFKTED